MSIQTKLPRCSARAIEALEIAFAQRAIEIEAELRGLDGDVRVETRRGNPIEHVEIVPRHLLGLVDARRVLAELRQDRRDALRLQLRRRAHRILDPLPGHEARRPTCRTNAVLRRAFAQPRIRRTGEQRFTEEGHGFLSYQLSDFSSQFQLQTSAVRLPASRLRLQQLQLSAYRRAARRSNCAIVAGLLVAD